MAKRSENQGRPIVWRHHYSGMWIGYASASDVPGHIRVDGARIRSWNGGPTRIDASSIAKLGTGPGDTITEWTTVDISLEGSVEIHDTSADHVETVRRRLS